MLFGDVLKESDRPSRPAGIVPNDFALAVNVTYLAIGADDPIVHLELSRSVYQVVCHLSDAGPVVRVDQLPGTRESRISAFAAPGPAPVQFIRPCDNIGFQVAVPLGKMGDPSACLVCVGFPPKTSAAGLSLDAQSKYDDQAIRQIVGQLFQNFNLLSGRTRRPLRAYMARTPNVRPSPLRGKEMEDLYPCCVICFAPGIEGGVVRNVVRDVIFSGPDRRPRRAAPAGSSFQVILTVSRYPAPNPACATGRTVLSPHPIRQTRPRPSDSRPIPPRLWQTCFNQADNVRRNRKRSCWPALGYADARKTRRSSPSHGSDSEYPISAELIWPSG